MIDLVGEDAFAHRGRPPGNDEWRTQSTIGLVVHSDATGQNAGPAILSEYLETLTRRTEEFLRQRCAFQKIVTVPLFSEAVNFSQALKVQGQRLQLPYAIVVVFSSREKTGPETIGEATMMTQMGGTVIENSALVEVGIIRLSDFTGVFEASGIGTETLEQLDAPIGSNRPSPTVARDIVRARAGQQALDVALDRVGSACQRGTEKQPSVTGSFRIANRDRSPAPSDAS
jgi:hypothetical protein